MGGEDLEGEGGGWEERTLRGEGGDGGRMDSVTLHL